MKIIQLTTENVKKVVAFHLEPQGNMITIGGNNANGKTSVLDSIIMALSGGRSLGDKPLREGTEKGYSKIITEDYEIIRTFNESGSQLTIKNKDGAVFSKPQDMLNGLIGKISFDPMAFAMSDTDKQINVLKSLIDYDFNTYETTRKAKYDERTGINRDVKTLEAELSGITYDETAEEGVSITELLKELEDKNRRNSERAQEEQNILAMENEITQIRTKIAELSAKLTDMITMLDKNKINLTSMPEYDVTELKASIANSEKLSDAINNNRRFKEIQDKLSVKKEEQIKINAEIDKLDQDKAEAIQKAGLPIPDLSFSEDAVIYKGLPLSVASSAEKLKVSVALGMALNPKMRVLIIKDGSLLDAENLKVIEQMAKDNDYQIWVEKVGENEDMTVIMVDGHMQSDLLFKE